ncbi:MAG: DnaA regulatory inactivator Hda, partial [Burkholderiales bacterium]|nr:DnaA regulatory inactivator Hda [Burkholderiales bacterium]
MQQLIFDLFPASPPSFDNFVAGRNEEALAAVRDFVKGFVDSVPVSATSLYLWGANGAGKTHLLQAARAQALSLGFAVHTLANNRPFPPLSVWTMSPALWIVDDVDCANEELQGYLFTVYNALKANGGGLIATAPVPPAQLTLREDLRTRLGWGGIYEITTLRDDDKLQALIAYANARGLRLPADIVAYLLKHSRRDMRSLVAVLDALDRYSLSLKRP